MLVSAIPFQVVTEHQGELPVLYNSFSLAIYFAYSNICFNAILSVGPTLSFPRSVCKFIPYIHVSIPTL